MTDRGTTTGRPDLTGRRVVAHPSRVAQADQIAAAEQIEQVILNEYVPTTHAYVIDLDALTKLPERGFFDV